MGRRVAAGAPRRRAAALGIVLALAASSAGCALLFGGMGTAPSGLSTSDQELRTLLAGGRSARALEELGDDGPPGWVGDELLHLQYRGLAAHYAGRWEESSRALEQAFALAEDRYTKSVARALLSLVTSDRILAYEPPRPERLFLHYYGALNYLRRGEEDEAAVEVRRMGRVLGRALEEGDASVPPDLGRALSVFAGTVFEAAGELNDAAVSYRRARAFEAEEGTGERGPPDGSPGAGDRWAGEADPWAEDAVVAGAEGAASGPTGRVLVVLERGFVAHKVERDLTFFLLPGELERLHAFRSAAEADTAAPDTAALLGLAERVADRSLGPRSPRAFRRRGIDAGDAVLVRIAWPELREASRDGGPAALRVDGTPSAGRPAVEADLSAAVREAFRGSRVLLMAKSLLRAAAKLSIAEGLGDAVSDESETLGDVVEIAAQVVGAVLERADTRSWHLLPGRLELYLLRLPPGSHDLEARIGGASGGRIELGAVDVEAGELRVVTARQWR